MRFIFEDLVSLLVVIAWIAGTVLAPGILKLLAIVLPPYAWYLLVERITQITNLIT